MSWKLNFISNKCKTYRYFLNNIKQKCNKIKIKYENKFYNEIDTSFIRLPRRVLFSLRSNKGVNKSEKYVWENE